MSESSFVTRALRVLALLAALVLLGAAAVRAFVHLRDLTGIQHIAGIWMALAQYSDAGILYPPLELEGVYAGTRYMPVCFLLIAALVKLTGDYVAAAKLMALASMLLLLCGVFVAVRRSTGRVLDALVLTALVLAFPEGRAALLSPHADALAAALALAGLLVIERGKLGAGRIGLATLLFTAALLTKFSAVAGPAAAGVYLLRRDRKGALGLILIWLVLSASGLALVEHLSAGRFEDNFRSLGSGGMSLDSIRIAPARIAFALRQTLPCTLVLALATGTLLLRDRERGLSLWDWYFLATAAVTLAIFTSPGTGLNHLVELEVASVLVVAQWLDPQEALARRGSMVSLAVLAVLLVGVFGTLRDGEYPQGSGGVPGSALADALSPEARILAEDATVPVLLGRRPVVMDPFAFRVLAERGRVEDGALADRVERGEFDALVLMGRVDRPDESLCPRFHFGPRVTAAMRQAYRFERQVGPYYVFVPKAPQNCN